MNDPTPFTEPNAAGTMGRRPWLRAAVVAAVVGGGSGVIWRGYQSWLDAKKSAEAALWQMEFDTPEGARLRMGALHGRPLLLNFWATWCPPCIEELPLLSRFYTENSTNGWQVLGLAVDKPESVKRFLARTPVSFPVAMATARGREISMSLGNTNAGLPFTAVLGSSGQLAGSKIGLLSSADLSGWAALR